MNTVIGPTDEQLDTMRQNIFSSIAPTRRRKRLPALRTGLITVGAVALAASVVVVTATGQLDARGASAEAAELLTTASNATINASDPAVGPDQFLKVETIASDLGWLPGRIPAAWPTTYTIYLPGDGGNDWVIERHVLAPTKYYTDNPEDAMNPDVIALIQDRMTDSVENGVFRAGGYYSRPGTAEDVNTMPRDPQELHDYFYATYKGGSGNADRDAWVRITDMLRTGTVPADLRAALYKTAALIPGIAVLGDATTIDGRTGTAIGPDNPDPDWVTPQLIIDPTTGLLIGTQIISTGIHPEIPTGSVESTSSTFTTVVDTTP